MSNAYQIRAARRERERQRDQAGDTPEPQPLGSHLSRAPCAQTPDMFTGLRKGKDTRDLFDQ